jgi:hypothetical protein
MSVLDSGRMDVGVGVEEFEEEEEAEMILVERYREDIPRANKSGLSAR